MYLQEVRQLTEAGIPILDMLAKKFTEVEHRTVSAGEAFERISNRMVSFKMVEEIFKDLTSAGGKFYDMQKKQADTLYGRISNLKDAFQIMLNDLGSQNEGVLKFFVESAYTFIKNWRLIADAIKVAVAAYGSYKAAVMVSNVVLRYQQTYAVQAALANAMAAKTGEAVAAANVRAATASIMLQRTLRAADGTMKYSFIGLAVGAAFALGAALFQAYQRAHELENALEKVFEDAFGEAQAAIAKMDMLLSRLKNANMFSQERAELIGELNNLYGSYLPALIKEGETYEEIASKVRMTTSAIYENAKAEAFRASQQKITESLGESLTNAREKATKGLTRWRLGKYAFTKEEAADMIQDLFTTIKNNPKLIASAQALTLYVNELMTNAVKKKGLQVRPGTSLINTYEEFFSAAQNFRSAIVEVKEAEDDAMLSIKLLSGSYSGLNKELDTLAQQYNLKMANSKRDVVNSDRQTRELMLENKQREINIWYLKQQIEINRKYKQFGPATDLEIKLKGLEQGVYFIRRFNEDLMKLKGFDKTILFSYRIKDEGKSTEDIKKSIKETYDQLKETWTSYQQNLSLIDPENIKSVKEQYLIYKAIVEQILKIRDLKAERSAKANALEDVQIEFKRIKSAVEAFRELSPKMASSELSDYMQRMYKDIPYVREEAVKRLTELYNSIKGFSDKKTRDVAFLIEDYIRKVNKDGIVRTLDDTLDNIQNWLDQNAQKFDTFQELLDQKVERQLAFSIAFSNDPAFLTATLADTIRDAMARVSDTIKLTVPITYDVESNLAELPEQLLDRIRVQQAVLRQGLKGQAQLPITLEELLAIDLTNKNLQSELKWPKEAVQMLINLRRQLDQTVLNSDKKLAVDHAKLIEQFGSLEQRRKQLEAYWREEIRKASGNPEAQKKMGEAMEKELFTLRDDYYSLFHDLSGLSLQGTEQLQDNLIKGLNELRENGKITKEMYDELFTSITDQAKASKVKDNPLGALFGTKSTSGNLITSYMSGGIDGMSNTMGKMGGQMSAIAAKFNIVMLIIEAINKLVNQTYGALLQVTSAAAEMQEALGHDESAEKWRNTNEQIGILANNYKKTYAQFKEGDVLGTIASTAELVMQTITSFAKKHDRKLEKSIQKSILQVKAYENAVKNLQWAADRALSTKSFDMKQEQMRLIEMQTNELYTQINLENRKKKKDKEKIADMYQQIEENRQRIADMRQQIVDDFMGGDFKSITEQLGDAFIEAFGKGEKAAEAWGKKVKEIMAGLVKKLIVQRLFEEKVKNLIDTLLPSGKDPLSLTEEELLDFSNKLAALGEFGEAAMQRIGDVLKKFITDAADVEKKSSLTDGIKGVTEETSQLLASLINSIRADASLQSSLLKNMEGLLTSSNSIQASSLAYLTRIESHTLNASLSLQKSLDVLQSVVLGAHPKGGSGIKVFA